MKSWFFQRISYSGSSSPPILHHKKYPRFSNFLPLLLQWKPKIWFKCAQMWLNCGFWMERIGWTWVEMWKLLRLWLLFRQKPHLKSLCSKLWPNLIRWGKETKSALPEKKSFPAVYFMPPFFGFFTDCGSSRQHQSFNTVSTKEPFIFLFAPTAAIFTGTFFGKKTDFFPKSWKYIFFRLYQYG